MKRLGSKASANQVIALAMTWDGARWPTRTLPPKAREFLNVKAGKLAEVGVPTARKLAKLFAEDQVKEIRICWVPRLKGGSEVLSEPFQTAEEMRIGFRSVKAVRFGEILGIVYRRATDSATSPRKHL